eukprot:scaffold58782_cov32-Cyclotella_meneghiniana.AAC.1
MVVYCLLISTCFFLLRNYYLTFIITVERTSHLGFHRITKSLTVEWRRRLDDGHGSVDGRRTSRRRTKGGGAAAATRTSEAGHGCRTSRGTAGTPMTTSGGAAGSTARRRATTTGGDAHAATTGVWTSGAVTVATSGAHGGDGYVGVSGAEGA